MPTETVQTLYVASRGKKEANCHTGVLGGGGEGISFCDEFAIIFKIESI